MSVTVRFAPSPTGPLHMGGVRTALYNYLFAKKHNGRFILRIEDTDQSRYVPGAEEYIMESLAWCGILWDEGPDKDGPHRPYRQSERKELYRKYALQLIESGHAYYAFDTPAELEAMRKRLESEKLSNPQYDCHTRMEMKNSLTMSKDQVNDHIASGNHYVIRAHIPEGREIVVNDLIRGQVRVNSSLLDDKVLFKSDGMPTYHLANVVDDHLMQVSHVIRGEEWLPSAPLHVLLYEFFGWHQSMPLFAHLPLLLKPDGNGKLSKRDGDRLGFPVFPLAWKDPKSGELSSGYKESGYFSEAFVNILALLGWNPGTDQEMFTMDELIESFTLDRVGKSGSKFDPEKAKWFNHQYLQSKSTEELAASYIRLLEEKDMQIDTQKAIRITAMVRERINFIHEMWEQTAFLFIAPSSYDEAFARKKWKPETPGILNALEKHLKEAIPFDVENISKAFQSYMDKTGTGMGQIMPGLRLALVGEGKGPDLKEIMEILGKEEVLTRIARATENL